MGRTSNLVAEIFALGRSINVALPRTGGSDSAAGHATSDADQATLSKILAELERMDGNDRVALMQQLYAKFEEYFRSTVLDSARRDEYLAKIRAGPVRDVLVTAILYKLSFPDDDRIHAAVLGPSLGAGKAVTPSHVLNAYGLSWFQPTRSEKALSVLDATLPGGSPSLALEYSLGALTSRRSAEAQKSWTSGISVGIVRRMTNIRPAINGPEGVCSGSEVSLEEVSGEINVRVGESCRKIDMGSEKLRPRDELLAFNQLARQAITKTACRAPYEVAATRRVKSYVKVNPIDFERIKLRERLLELWRAALTEQVPLNSRDVLGSLLDLGRLKSALSEDFVRLARTYKLNSAFEANITARAMLDNFLFVLNFEISGAIAGGIPRKLFTETPPQRVQHIVDIATNKLDQVLARMREGRTVRKVVVPRKIELVEREGLTI